MGGLLRAVLKDKILKTSALMAVAAVAAQLVGVANWAALTYLFEKKEDLGLYVVLLSYVPMLQLGALLGYDLALPNISDEDFPSLLLACIGILILFSFTVYGFSEFFSYPFAFSLGVLLIARGFGRIGEMVNTRLEQFALMAVVRLARPVSIAMLLAGSFLVGGLSIRDFVILVAFIELLVSVCYLLISFRKVSFSNGSLPGVRSLLRAHASNPLMVMPSTIMNSAAYNLPTILIEKFMGGALAAQYGIVLKFCCAPLNLLGGSISTVFHGKIAKARRAKVRGSMLEEIRRLRIMLVVFGFAACVCIAAGFPVLSTYILKGDWSHARNFAYLLLPLFFVMVAVAPLTSAFIVFDEKKYLFLNQLSYLIISLASFGLGLAINNLLVGIGVFSTLSIVRYLFINARLGQVLRRELA